MRSAAHFKANNATIQFAKEPKHFGRFRLIVTFSEFLATQTPTGQAGAYIVFTLIASTTIAFPIIAYLAAMQKAQALFDSWKTWLIRNNQAIGAVILLLVGALLVYRGIEFISMARA